MSKIDSSVPPNLFVLGGQKCGSTFIAELLGTHPDVFMAGKELHYFDKLHRVSKGRDWYLNHFGEGNGKKVVGEKTPEYLWANGVGAEGHNPNVHRELVAEFPDSKFIVMVRNPADRALSALVHMVKTGRIPLKVPLDRLFAKKNRALLKPWGIIEKGFYAQLLEAWFEYVDPSRFLILCFEEHLRKDLPQTMARVCRFLEIDPSHKFVSEGVFRNSSPKMVTDLRSFRRQPFADLEIAWRKIRHGSTSLKISKETRSNLLDLYRSDIARLETMVDFGPIQVWS